jgi:hypothetical protein
MLHLAIRLLTQTELVNNTKLINTVQ